MRLSLLFVWASIFIVLRSALAGEVAVEKDSQTGWELYTLTQGKTVVRVAPDAGCNAFSVKHCGIEYFRVPDDLKKLPGVGYGNPILYPMPNRVSNAEFDFEGQTFSFPKNRRGNFIHGLVHSESFDVESTQTDKQSAEITCSLSFVPKSKHFDRFPIQHVFRLTIKVTDGSVRWSYEVQNQDRERSVPFGVGLHPYLLYHGSRESAFLSVPATHLMEATGQLPTGELVELNEHPLDCRTFRSMRELDADDVFWGMTPDQPARIEFRESDLNETRRITFSASKEFTHLVLWTPDRPFFSIENQTCSTDAHNLTSNGKASAAHLQVCKPGQKLNGSVEYNFE